jgi:hypothetical protein
VLIDGDLGAPATMLAIEPHAAATDLPAGYAKAVEASREAADAAAAANRLFFPGFQPLSLMCW